MAGRGNSSLYKAIDPNGPVHRGPVNRYAFPSLTTEASETQTPERGDNGDFRPSSFGGSHGCTPEFTGLFDVNRDSEQAAEAPQEEDVQKQMEEIREKAYTEGFVEGEKAGAETEKAKLREALEALYTGISNLNAERRKLVMDSERCAVEIGLMIARKIVCREVSIDKEMIFGVLREALKKISDQKDIHVKLHPSDLTAVNAAQMDILNLSGTKENIILEPAENMGRGECVIETDLGGIDARLESQLQTVEESLRLALENGPMDGEISKQ